MSGNRPEQAATVTPGQAAYEAYAMAAPDEIDFTEPGDLPDWERGAWEAAAKAAVPGYRMLVDEALAERDRLTERVAELVTEGNELRAEVYRAHAETRSFLARMDTLARDLEVWSAFTAPSKKSEIEAALAKRLRAITRTDPAIDTPAVVTAGTEHLGGQLPAIPDEDGRP